MSIEQPSRRAVIKAGAWTAPAVVVATSVPAFAASGTGTGTGEPGSGGTGSGGTGSGGTSPAAALDVSNGQTRVTNNTTVPNYDGLRCDAFSIKVNRAVMPNDLTLTITATTSTGDPASVYIRESFNHTRLSPWVSSSPQNSPEAAITYTYPSGLAVGGEAIATGDAVVVLTNSYGQVPNPIITVVVTAPGFPSVSRQFQRSS